jgi:L-threonylcarbamoyladenylate synthase
MPLLLTPSCAADAPLADWLEDDAVAQAARQLARGGLLGLPTETVYGLAADAGQPEAVARIFSAKGRPADHPLIVHLAPQWLPGLAHHAVAVPEFAHALMRAFWPGPLTLILPRKPGVSDAAAGGQNSIGLRCPAHPAAQAVLQVAQGLGVLGVAAPSANRFGRVSPTQAAHVMDEFMPMDGHALKVLQGGACVVGIESTIVDATRGKPVVLRPGMVSASQIQEVCGQKVNPSSDAACAREAPKASGTLASHYAPHARVRLMDTATLQAAVEMLAATPLPPHQRPGVAVYARSTLGLAPVRLGERLPVLRGSLWWRPMPSQAAACARELFAALREFDDVGAQLIWVEVVPDDSAWDGVRDRLERAAH